MSITLYVNGDSHTAGTYKNYFSNLEECATALLAKKYNLNYINRARAGGSNARIIRITKQNLEQLDPNSTVIFIGWSTFERTEWVEDGIWHQICGQPWYNVSDSLKSKWQEYIAWSSDLKNYYQLTVDCQKEIYDFHCWLKDHKFAHRFYHANEFFNLEANDKIFWPDNLWVKNSPYSGNFSFTNYSQSNKFQPDDYFHFDYQAHKLYADLLENDLNDMLKELKNNVTA